jgi:RsiW-degrading membrane proteinase PrsW (M82 family)
MIVLLALAPALLILVWVDRQDLHPEPRRVVWTTFLLGALAVAPVALVERCADTVFADLRWSTLPHTFFTTLFGVALPEELARFAVLALYARRHRAFDEPMDGLVYGAAAALGFASVENVLYVFDGGANTALMRGLLAVPGHAFDGMLMGALLSVGMIRPRAGGRSTALALLLPIACHTLYDAPMLLAFTPFTTGLAPSWSTVAAAIALAPLPIVVTALQWSAVRDLAARLRRAQLAAHSGTTTARPLVPLVGGLVEGLLRWAQNGGLRSLCKLGALSSALAVFVLGLVGLASLLWSDAIQGAAAEMMADPTTMPELTRLGADGCVRTMALLLGAAFAGNLSLVGGCLYAARRLR